MAYTILDKAVGFATAAHDGQFYDNGEPFVSHPLQVYEVLQHVTDDVNILAAAILHDTIEDTDVTYEELATEFNIDIADLVMEVTQEAKNQFPRLNTKRGYIIKFADRLCNLSHMGVWPEEKQQAYMAKSVFWTK